MKKILITGSQGQLGKALNVFYSNAKDVELINTDVGELNITDEAEVLEKILAIKPDVIINCAAHTQVDACESEQERAFQINALGPKNLSKAVNEVDAVLVHISSDYVFDGKEKVAYTEDDSYNPQSVYGATKLEGEEFVRNIAKRYFIVRTAWLYGEGKNFVNVMFGLAKDRDEVKVVSDQFGTPTSAEEVVKVIDLLCNSHKYGTYHATCAGSCSWFEFAQTIFDMCGCNVKVTPVTTEEYGAVAPRPKYSILENKKLKEEFGYHMLEWHEALSKYLADRLLVKEEN